MRVATSVAVIAITALGFWSRAAQAVTVNATDEIYSAGQRRALYGGSLPVAVTLGAGAASLSFSGVTGSATCTASTSGCVSLNSGANYNDADGAGAAVGSSSNSGAGSISGITGPGAGYLVGVFVASAGPSGTAPAALNFTSGGLGTSFSSLSPLLDQVFFVGDGLTGDGTGSAQTFYVPTGAATLYLGISDAGGYNGSPGFYGDNLGAYSVTVNQASGSSSVPEPSGLAMFGLGLVALTMVRRTRSFAR